MQNNPTITDPDKIIFNEADFTLLMQKRIQKILLICSSYDAYMLEEDGRIDEQIFNEYVSLNLRRPPSFIHTDSAQKALDILSAESIDMVIEMLSIPDVDTFDLANKIKRRHPDIPIVVLTHFSREVSLRLRNENLGAVDQVFCWLGNADLLLAIIKLFEDRMNAEHDVENVGVQTIMLVEDSVRFTSAYLPELYKSIFLQSREFLKEALNEHQRRMRMRGRPKVLLARTYAEALLLYNKYKRSLLGIISDIQMKEDKGTYEKMDGGIQLCKLIKKEDPFLPFVFQSSDRQKEMTARELGVGFIHKYSKTLSSDLRNYITRNFGFGDFVFLDPANNTEISRASDLVSLQHQILTIPDDTLRFHASRNEISKWLNARSLFPIAKMFRQLQLEDFPSLQDARNYLFKAMGNYRLSRAKGVIATFSRDTFDDYLLFARIGQGSVGGKARGLVFLSSIIKNNPVFSSFPGVSVEIPRTVVLTTDVFEEFMEINKLYQRVLTNLSDEETLRIFLESNLPEDLVEDLKVFLKFIRNPVAVRSSSKLEDSMYQPFAGVYSTYMVPLKENDPEKNLKNISNAIKGVYASVFYKSSKAYMQATSNVLDEEKMGIILQEVCGKSYEGRFYPTLSGVARSLNFYPVKPEKTEDGYVNLGFGLGKYVVDGGVTIRFSPKYPKNILQLSSPATALKETQKIFYSLDLSKDEFSVTTDESANLLKLKIQEAEKDHTLRFVASTYDLENNMIRDSIEGTGKKLITFSHVLQYETFPLARILESMLKISQKEMGNPVEIEFAVNLDVPPGKPKIFSFLQIRPIVVNDQRINLVYEEVPEEKTIITSRSALGNGSIDNITDLVYVKPESFRPAETKKIALSLEQLNSRFITEKRNYILTGPGRWGSTDPWLGIPIKWPQISEARIIVESGLSNYRIDPSQGTHFFQNLTTFRVGYFTINPYNNEGFYDINYLNSKPAAFEDAHIRHVRFSRPLKIFIDGRKNLGMILKPEE